MEYIYWVEAGGSQLGVQRFKTAGTNGSYNFLWMSDRGFNHRGLARKLERRTCRECRDADGVDVTRVRGHLYVLVADSLADIERFGTKINGMVADISKLIGIDTSVSVKFFKVGIDYAVVE